ncbi:hypothetical protein HYG81_14970 [Natrinema zhouii]|uniref:Uncharacterized protein n=1 Tax=Natrinema zhouii TaxID=1710539 RepID=A0A7D6CMV8_9EURY|nr:hypothetical protein [Natrinema zhouii]QLK25375.1 hypothetical protein HYG81_14970 [Natrinema zhouii]
MTGGSYRTCCDDCESKIRASAHYCPDCGERQQWFTDDEEPDGNLEEVFRRETITEAGDGGLLVGEREVVDRVDDVCSELEALRDEVDNPDVQAALRSAIGSAWSASVIQRLDENSDIRMIADTGRGSTSVRGPVTDVYTRERGESR